MAKCVVIADDLTGANATGVALKRQGFDTYTVLDASRAKDPALAQADCIMVPTDSRSIAPEEAYKRVHAAVSLLAGPEVLVWSKRIDSTLRGNLGSETDAFLDVLGPDTMAVCVPCFPSSHRILVGGYLLVNALPLHQTEVAADPKNPIHTSEAALLYRQQSQYPVASVFLRDLCLGKEHLIRLFRDCHAQGVRTVICDSVTQEDMELIADALVESGLKFFAVDPGVFTATVAKRYITPSEDTYRGRILCAIGSVNGVARGQVKELLSQMRVQSVTIETRDLLESPKSREHEIGRVVEAVVEGCDGYDLCAIVGSGIDPARRVPFAPYAQRYGCTEETLSGIINDSIAEMACRILASQKDFRGIYTTGGDITSAVNQRLGTSGLRLLDEVVPLAGYGQMMGGPFDGLKFVSKGGMVGDPNAMVTCMKYMKARL